MQYVRSISGSVSKTWNSINPATLSGAIDVIVIEQEDGQHVLRRRKRCANRFGRNAGMLSLPRSVWQILAASTIREKGIAARKYRFTPP
jgi:phosphatidate phosphatase LPIN